MSRFKQTCNYLGKGSLLAIGLAFLSTILFFLSAVSVQLLHNRIPETTARGLETIVYLPQNITDSLYAPLSSKNFPSTLVVLNTHDNLGEPSVLAAEDTVATSSSTINFNVASAFNQDSHFKKNVTIDGQLTAPNVVYSITGGSGIGVTGGQNAVITNTGVLSVQGQTGAVTLTPGSGITIDGTTIASTVTPGITSLEAGTGISVNGNVISSTVSPGITSLQAGSGISVSGNTITNTGIITLAAGTGISVSGNTVTNSDTGSAQNIFKTIAVSGQSDILASSNSDTLTFVAGTGVTLATDATNKTVTITSNGASPSFTDITSGTNTQAAMVVGTGASLSYTGSGTIAATSLLGSTWASPGAIGSTTPNSGAFSTLSVGGKTITLAGNFATSGANNLTLTTTGATNVTLPTTGTLLTNTETANQSITSTQNSGTIFSLADNTAPASALTGLSITLSDTSGTSQRAGIAFNLANAASANVYDILGTGSSWNVTRAGDATFNSVNVPSLNTSGGTVNINVNSNNDTNINTGTSTGTVSVGGGSATVAIDTATWDISGAGVASGFTGLTSSGTVRFSNLTTNGPVYTTGGNGTLASEAQLSTTRGGTGLGSYSTGDMIYASGANTLTTLALGSDNRVLMISPTTHLPVWATITGGGGGGCSDCVVTDPSTTATNKIVPTLTGVVPLTLQKFTGTSADLFNVVDTDGSTVLFGINSSGVINTGTWNGTAIGPTYGGTGQTSWATGDLLYASGVDTLAKLSAGNNGDVLVLSSGVPSWANSSTLSPCANCLVNNPTSTSINTIAPATDGVTGLIVKKTSIPTTPTDIFSVQNAAGSTKYLKIDSSGDTTFNDNVYFANGTTYYVNSTGDAVFKDITGAAITGTTFNNLSLNAAVTGFTISGGSGTSKQLTVTQNLTLTGTTGKILTLNDNTTLGTNSIGFAGTETLTLAAAKNVSFADAFATSGSNPITLTSTGNTNVTLPTTGTLLTNTESANQTITSTQTSGTLFSLADSTNISAATTGMDITLSGTGGFDQTGLKFNLSGASGTNLNDIVGSSSTWKVSTTGTATFAQLGVGTTNLTGYTMNVHGSNLIYLDTYGGVRIGDATNQNNGSTFTVDDNNQYAYFLNNSVGIGTSTPASKLDVRGGIRLGANTSTNNILNTSSGSAPSGDLFWGDRIVCDSSGNCGGATGAYVALQSSTPGTQQTGNLNISGTGLFGGNVGIGTTAPEFKLDVNSDGGIIARGTFGSGNSLTTAGAGTRMFWYPKKSAFRAGTVSGTRWDDANIGNYSMALGTDVTALGTGAIGLGSYLYNPQDYAVAIGSGINNSSPLNALASNSLSIGFNSDVPTLTVSASNGSGTTGNVGVGLGLTTPSYKLDILSAGTAQTASNRVANFSNSGATFDTTSGALSSYGGYFTSSSTRSTGSNALTNVGLYATASGAQNNYAAIFESGNVGIGVTNPAALLSVGSSSAFQVNSSGAITAATGITSSGTINFSTLSASSAVYTDGSKNLTTTAPTSGTIGYWSRSGTTLSPATASDTVQLTTGALQFNSSTYKISQPASSGLAFDSSIDATRTNGFKFTSSVATGGVAGQNGVSLSQSKSTAEAFSFNGLNIATTLNAASGTQNVVRGMLNVVTNSGAATITQAYALHGRVDNTSTGTIGQSIAAYLDANINSGGGTVTGNYGLYVESQTVGSTNNYGIYAVQPGLANSIGSTTNSSALFIPSSTIAMGNQTATTTNAYTTRLGQITYTSTTNTRTITNPATLYIEGAPVASTNVTFTNGPYALYSAAGTNYFGGNVGIGVTNPAQKLDVVGNIKNLTASTSLPSTHTSTVNVGDARDVFVQGKYAYSVDKTSGRLVITDVTNVSSPTAYATTGLPSIYRIVVAGKYAYIGGAGAFLIYDVSNVTTPTQMYNSSLGGSLSGNIVGLAVSGKYAYLADGANNNIYVVDISNPSSPSIVSTIAPGWSTTQNVTVQGNYLYAINSGTTTCGTLAGTTDAFKIYDISNPASPTLKNSSTTIALACAQWVQVSGRYAYVTMGNATGGNKLQIIDISDPTTPATVTNISTGTSPSGLFIAGKYAYITNQASATLQFFDISNPSSPSSLGTVGTDTTPDSVYVSGRYAYVVAQNGTLRLYDISGTETTSILAHSIEGSALQIKDNAVIGNNLYVGGGLNIGGGGLLSNGDVGINGSLSMTGIQPAAVSTATGTTANALLSLVGGTGGNTSNNTGTGGIGGALNLTGGTGGVGTGTTSETGGKGGGLTFTGGAGGAPSSGTTRNGGAGGDLSFVGGSGGTTAGGTNRTAGNGGSIFIVGGAKGTGSTTGTPTDGNVYLGVTTGGTARGSVGIGNTSPSAALDVTGTGRFTSTLFANSGFQQAGGSFTVTATAGQITLSNMSASSMDFGSNALTITSSNFSTTSTGINSTAIGATTASTGAFTTLVTSSTIQAGGLLTLNSAGITGGGLSSDCSASGQKLLWSSSTKQFSCGSDSASVALRKSSDQSVTSSTTLTDVTDLSFSVGAGEKWGFTVYDVVSAGTGGETDYAISTPTGSTCATRAAGWNTTGYNVSTTCGGRMYVTSSSANEDPHEIIGTVTTGVTSGTIKLQFSQHASSGTATTIRAGALMLAYKLTGADLAEVYYSNDPSIRPGEIVQLDPSFKGGIKKTNISYQKTAMGIVSTQPGMVIGDTTGSEHGTPVLLALSGRVPVKVSTINGPIHAGDYITSSEIPGYGMKSIQSGQIVAKALEDFDPENGVGNVIPCPEGDTGHTCGVVLAFSSVGYADPNDTLAKVTFDENGHLVTADQQVNSQFRDTTATTLSTLSDRLTTIEGQYASLEAQIQNSSLEPNATQSADLSLLTQQVASLSAQVQTNTNKVDDLERELHMLELNASASGSGQLNASNSATLSALLVTGDTNVNNLAVTGTFTQGLLTMNGLETLNGLTGVAINSLAAPLRIQSTATGPIEFEAAKIVMDTVGNITIKDGDLILEHGRVLGNDSMRDAVDVNAGQTTINVTQNWDSVPVSITATASYDSYVWIDNITTTGFTIHIKTSPTSRSKIYWTALW
jgi:hypothetical protein